MTAELETRSDQDIQRDVLTELSWDGRVSPQTIGVIVLDGIVTLSGQVDSFFKKWAAEDAALRVRGVNAVANELEVELPATDRRTDDEIARAAAQALAGDTLLGPQQLQVTVSDGWITVHGEVEWNYQRAEAEHLLRRLWGVTGVTNQIEVVTRPSAPDLERRIREALLRIAKVDAERVQVDVDGGTAILMGTVRSWAEREEIERTAWQAPGITRVEDRIQVIPA